MELLARPEFRAMFLDDLLNSAGFQVTAALSDSVLFTRDWGIEVMDIEMPVCWWHANKDHIVPFRHAQHVVDRLARATMTVVDGESHLGGLGLAEEVPSTLMERGPRSLRVARC